jgi:hypothetical protein
MGGYDWRFPAERRALDNQFAFLQSLSSVDRNQLLREFSSLSLPSNLATEDWVGHPQSFMDGLTAHLWSTLQIGTFRDAAEQYADAWRKAIQEPAPIIPRLCVVMFDKDLRKTDYPLFRKLRPHGVFFPVVDPSDAWPTMLEAASSRAARYPVEYGHWYIDGGSPEPTVYSGLAQVSWAALGLIRKDILARMRTVIDSGHGGPEELRTLMADTSSKDLIPSVNQPDEILSRFQISVLTEGSGTQVFSTTFVQWTAREALRRAQPCTLVIRYAARQRQLPMNELLSGVGGQSVTDPEGSLVDADMGAFYTWINQQRLAGSDRASFLAWSEAHNQAVAIGPLMPRATISTNTPTIKQLLNYLA